MLRQRVPAGRPVVVPGWIVLPTAFVAAFSMSVLGHGAGLHGHLGALPVLVSALACATFAKPWPAVACGAVGWAFATGFVVNGQGLLTFERADLILLVASLTGALVAGSISGAYRTRPDH